MVLPNNMLGVREQINTLAGNNAGAKAIGNKRKEVLFNASYADNGRVSFVESSTRMAISERGALQKTGNRGDIALSSGNGMFIFKRNINDDSEQGFVYKSTQSLRIDKDGNLSTSADGNGYKLMGFKYNDEGQLSQVTSLLSSMEAVNLKSIVSGPEATTEILVNRLTLDAKQEVLKGAGVVARPNRNGANSNLRFGSIIMPEITATSSLKQGDIFTFAASGTNISRTFEYGGVSISKQVSRDMYGANSASTTFNIAPIGAAPVVPPGVGIRNLITDSGLTIQIGGGVIHQFQANQISNAQERKFNSLSTLKDAINTIPGLTAEITRDNRLLIAANDLDTSNQPIAFANLGTSNMVEVLGLANVPAAAAGVTRFASLSVLREAVNLDGENTLLSAERLGENLDIHALLATSNFTVTGNSTGATTFATSETGIPYTTAQGGAARGQAAVQITSPAHGLRKGDFVNVTGVGAGIADGKYMVGDVPTTDTFIIGPKLSAGAVPPQGPAIIGRNGTWQKIPGQGFAPFLNATVTANAANVVTITANAHNLANNDIIYLSGLGKVNIGAGNNVTLPDGYYTVTVANANSFTITAAANAANVVGDPVATPFTFQKVGNSGGVFANAFNPSVIRTTNGLRTVQVVVPHSSYNLGDDFRLTGLLGDLPVVVNGVTIRPDTIYTVTAKGATAAPEGFEYISFEVPAADGPANANGDANYTAMGPNFKIDDYSRSFQYLNIDPKKSIYTKTYDADVDTLSLSNLDPTNEHRKKGRVFHYSTAIYDSLGVEHKITMNFARLNKNDWAVEIAGVVDANGDFDFVANGREDGLIASGTIGFDNNGNFASSRVPTLNITWTNDGSAPSAIVINWDDVLNGAGIKQYGGQPSVADSVKPNGHSAGTTVNFEIDSNGDVYAILNNNQDPVLAFKLALAMFDNIDGMVGAEDGFFRPTGDSGVPKIRFAGENGAPTVISKTIESSNIDSLSTILELNSAGNDFRGTIAIVTADDSLTKDAIAKVGSI